MDQLRLADGLERRSILAPRRIAEISRRRHDDEGRIWYMRIYL